MLAACSHAPVQGQLSQQAIDKVVRRHRGEVRSCYDIGLSRNAALAGRVDLLFTVAPSGVPQAVRIGASQLEQPEVERCLLAVAARWRFPRATTSTPVELPLQFAAEEDFADPGMR